MVSSYKNKDYISQLTKQELINYYGCLAHHHQNRKNCCSKQNHNTTQRTANTGCQCTCDDLNDKGHFCTSYSADKQQCECPQTKGSLDESNCCLEHDRSLIVCENYAPSYTSKQDQIAFLKKEVGIMKRSKSELRKTMADLDKLLEEASDQSINKKENNGNDGFDIVENFYRSEKFIGSSMNIKSLKKYLPRTDISTNNYSVDVRQNKLKPPGTMPLFDFYHKNMFADTANPGFKIRTKPAVLNNKA